MIKMFRTLMPVFAALMVVSCKTPEEPYSPPVTPGEKDNPSQKDEEGYVNGVKIKDESTVYGLISDDSGNPVSGVPVTDGYKFTTTNAKGVYEMVADPNSVFIYYTLPAQYEISLNSSSHLPSFYTKINPAKKTRVDFTLKKRASVPSEFAFGVFGDIHIKKAEDAVSLTNYGMVQMAKYMNDNCAGMPCFGVSLGDINDNNRADFWPDARKALGGARLSSGAFLPFYAVIGNHDHNGRTGNPAYEGKEEFDIGTTGNFNAAFGPTCYSFDMGKVHFVAIDNYIAMGAPTSSGTALAGKGASGLSAAVLAWLQADVAHVKGKEDKMIVVLQHCHQRGFGPSGYQNFNEELDAIKGFRDAYIFSGHAHICESYKYTSYKTGSGRYIMERIHGVPMGNFWESRYSPDGSPAGFYVYKVVGNQFLSWEFQNTHDPDDQMRLYDSQAKYDLDGAWSNRYRWTRSWNANPATSGIDEGNNSKNLYLSGNYLLAHIYHGDEDWQVSLIEDGVEKKMTFSNTRTNDYCVHCHFANDLKLKTTYRYYWDKSENFWYIKLDKPVSQLKNWKVVAKAVYPGSGETKVYECDHLTSSVKE